MEMTISQALRRVKKLKGLLAEHQSRAKLGVSYLESNVPSFRFCDEIVKMEEVTVELISLESRIAVANANNTVTEESVPITLSMAIRTLQEIKGQISFYQSLVLKSGIEKTRENNWDDVLEKQVIRLVEVKYVSDLSEVDRDSKVKSLQDRFERLNNLVENANHSILI